MALLDGVDELSVMDMTGKTILERRGLSSYETIDLSGFSNGIYIFQVKINKGVIYTKVIKK